MNGDNTNLENKQFKVENIPPTFDPYHSLKKFPIEELWRFFIPNYNHKKAESILSNNLSERVHSGHIVKKCYLERMLNTFNFVLENRATELNINFINELHWHATSRLIHNTQYNPETHMPEQGGKFRTREEEIFKLTPENTTRDGIQEIAMHIKEKAKLNIHFDIKGQEKHHKDVHSHSQATSILHHSAAYIHAAITDQWKEYEVTFHSKVNPQKLPDIMNDYIHQYSSAIKMQTDSTLKIKCIVSFIRDCEQLHPYSDGNTRVFATLLLNHLLMQNHFPPTILDYPHNFKAHSTLELIHDVKKGIARTLILIQTGHANEFSEVDTQTVLEREDAKKFYMEMLKTNVPALFNERAP